MMQILAEVIGEQQEDKGEVMSICPECYEDTGCTCRENERIAEMEIQLAEAQLPRLARHQPCGCIVCSCEGDQCLGCGASNCGTHPVGEIPNPIYEHHPLQRQLAEAIARVKELEAIAESESCEWEEPFGKDYWRTECGKKYYHHKGKEVVYCQYCGKLINTDKGE